MKDDVESLSDRERETLCLLGRGHEAKSIAATLGISIHSVNERLRTARRKLGVSSSREAARLLLAREAGSTGAENPGYKKMGVAPARADEPNSPPAHSRAAGARRRATWVVIGVLMLTVLISVLIAANSGGNAPAATQHGPRGAEPLSSLPSLFAV